MPLEHILGPRHWRIEDFDGGFVLKSKSREEAGWDIMNRFDTEDDALAAVQNLPTTFPYLQEAAGHFAPAFDRKYWKRVS